MVIKTFLIGPYFARLHTELLANEDNLRGIRRALQRLPSDLYTTYNEALRRIEGQGRQKAKRAEQLLSWILHAEEPLTIRELQHALAIEPDDTFLDAEALPDEEYLVSVCAGMVVVEEASHLVHYTTQECFNRIRRDRFPSAESDIFSTCATYLVFDVFSTWPLPRQLEYSILHFSQSQDYPLLVYSARHWGHHARRALDEDPKASHKILDFCKKQHEIFCCFQALCFGSQRVSNSGAYNCFPEAAHAIHIAAFLGLDAVITILLSEGVNMNAKASDGRTALHMAAMGGHETTAKLLLDSGAAIDLQDRRGWTPLTDAFIAGSQPTVRLLLKRGGNPLIRSWSGLSTLHYVNHKGREAVVSCLLKHMDIQSRYANAAALVPDMAYDNQSAMLHLLLSQWVDCADRIRLAAAVLQQAIMREQFTVANYLLEEELHDVANDVVMENSLYTAIANGKKVVVQWLFDKGIRFIPQSDRGQNALRQALSQASDFGVEWLLEYGADIDMTSCGETPLIKAAKSGKEELVRLLTIKGANIAAHDATMNRTALD